MIGNSLETTKAKDFHCCNYFVSAQKCLNSGQVEYLLQKVLHFTQASVGNYFYSRTHRNFNFISAREKIAACFMSCNDFLVEICCRVQIARHNRHCNSLLSRAMQQKNKFTRHCEHRTNFDLAHQFALKKIFKMFSFVLHVVFSFGIKSGYFSCGFA